MSDNDKDKDSSVRVAVRIRPQIPRELIDMCRVCTQVTPNEPQVLLGTDKAFTYDFVFDMNATQAEIYDKCVEKLIEGALRGYNATVLAYGQTGSGKTYTMGTGFDREILEMQEGIIPRAVRHLFSGIEDVQTRGEDSNGVVVGTVQFSVAAQFMELYNEEIIDLLDPYNKGKAYKIHEDPSGGISVSGATIKPIAGPQDALRCLQQGALARTTASTQMNAQSSRSHALFTILIRRQRVMSAEESGMPDGDLETLTSKFHFVDLAGSERLKRTGATGERAREGISINCGLLSLGNVISALGDKSKKASHVPYRDSKLTRLLQDSLGGNSQTVMIACVSPSDRDFMETLNTLKYANRARNIKNRVQINQDQSSRTISQLRREIAALQLELLEYKQGKRSVDAEGNPAVSDTFHENAMLLQDNKRLQQRLKAMQESVNALTERNAELLSEKAIAGWGAIGDSDKSMSEMVAGYLKEIEKLKAKLIESDQMYQQLKKTTNTPRGFNKNQFFGGEDADGVLTLAKREIEKERELLMSRSLPGLDDTNNQNVENESDSDSDTESDDKTGEMQAELNDISSDIELKTKLIEQLELSQLRMRRMQEHYEEKLNVLTAKITDTQRERDKVLANMGAINPSGPPSDKVRKVRDEYERKLGDMQRELRKLQAAQREHKRQQRELQMQEAQLKSLRSELSDLKSNKIKLIRRMNEEVKRHNEEETRKSREIAQLRKEARKHQNTIKSLQAQGAAKDQVLKRKTEQVSALRRVQRTPLSAKASGRVNGRKHLEEFNVRQARAKWETLQRTISRAARSRQAVVELERELERLLNDRDILSHDLTNVKRRQKMHPTSELASEEDDITSNLNYIQENITQVQHAIMELEEGKESATEALSMQNILESVHSVEEAIFFMERLCGAAISQTCDVAITEMRLKEREALLNEVQQDSSIQQQLLQHVLSQTPVSFPESYAGSCSNAGRQSPTNSISSTSTFDIPPSASILHTEFSRDANNGFSPSSSRSPSPGFDTDSTRSSMRMTKVRRLKAQPQELLFGSSNEKDDSMTRSYHLQQESGRSFIPISRVPSAPGSLKGLQPNPAPQSLRPPNSPLFPRKSFDTATPLSPRLTRRPFPNKASPGLEDSDALPPQSPPVYRRMGSREDASSDVFSRLGAGNQDPPTGGSIREFNGKPRANVPLHCTHVVEGHSNSVLSVRVFDATLFTAAADRTVKVWDMTTGTSSHCLSAHPGPVIAVEYDSKRNLLFSASGGFIRAWDLRMSTARPVKTLCSSGSTLSGLAALNPQGESPITALCMGASGSLYTAASDKVRIWDVRQFGCTGKLSGGHQAAVMCVTAWSGPNNTDFLATGSKDHYVKVFEVSSSSGVVLPLLHLEPPHYDGVQALTVANDGIGVDAELFSGSRDTGIKRWDLRTGELKQSLNNAHKGWVSGMAICGDVLLSSCRGGIVRLWSVRTCDSLAEMKTDSPINDIVVADQRIYTASNSGEVRIWRFSPSDFVNLTTSAN
ncbi:kinesin-like protein KIF21B isoform X1 [Phlebotomus argentipes]|uniref:kinesin-like protein KIF21B isoform X1 n=1 Tax=Phlebotomus argentipes TaxID=94469 RepID=UPI0028935BE9|nr:kinesin-like protein KIF21B isoform X1 [Phlebotomus argentipes]